MEQLLQSNESLATISKLAFGEDMVLKMVSPKSLTLLKDNARYFKRETFRQLRDNIMQDKKLSSVPLCYRYENDKGVEVLEVLSGNHRVKAAIEAGIELVLVLVIVVPLESSKKIAIQLSHNALVGEDDQSILASLWAQIESVEDKLYSGLDSESLKDLDENIELVNFSAPTVPAHLVTFMFTDAERESLSEVIDMVNDEAKKSKNLYLAHGSGYESFLNMVQDVKNSEKIKDSSLAMLKIVEIIQEYYQKAEATA